MESYRAVHQHRLFSYMMEISLPNDIIKSHLPHTHSSLFSLLAHTAEQGFSLLTDEILHLAGAMEAAGFRSVVGTMWAMVDDGAPYVVVIDHD